MVTKQSSIELRIDFSTWLFLNAIAKLSESGVTVFDFVKLENQIRFVKKGKKYLPLKLLITMSLNAKAIGNSNILPFRLWHGCGR